MNINGGLAISALECLKLAKDGGEGELDIALQFQRDWVGGGGLIKLAYINVT